MDENVIDAQWIAKTVKAAMRHGDGVSIPRSVQRWWDRTACAHERAASHLNRCIDVANRRLSRVRTAEAYTALATASERYNLSCEMIVALATAIELRLKPESPLAARFQRAADVTPFELGHVVTDVDGSDSWVRPSTGDRIAIMCLVTPYRANVVCANGRKVVVRAETEEKLDAAVRRVRGVQRSVRAFVAGHAWEVYQ